MTPAILEVSHWAGSDTVRTGGRESRNAIAGRCRGTCLPADRCARFMRRLPLMGQRGVRPCAQWAGPTKALLRNEGPSMGWSVHAPGDCAARPGPLGWTRVSTTDANWRATRTVGRPESAAGSTDAMARSRLRLLTTGLASASSVSAGGRRGDPCQLPVGGSGGRRPDRPAHPARGVSGRFADAHRLQHLGELGAILWRGLGRRDATVVPGFPAWQGSENAIGESSRVSTAGPLLPSPSAVLRKTA